MATRARWKLAATAVATSVVHQLALYGSFLMVMHAFVERGAASEAPFVISRVGTALWCVLGFPFIELALWLRTTDSLEPWVIGASTLSSASWAAFAVWLVRRRLRRAERSA